ncbi:hypothetical protein C5C55_16070 [Rathayibacter sp. AY1C2]|uniref:hypothetical protein n=1 Tax=Rathayibacter sp. AY1C2 TaxID=2080535 RepID=UPI000CE73A0B|nr:hypothetical protein [Rathayibacter sp. AY1C2]PPF52111.1 hypothetical protein C5C55_16070 [Rathayibacter sp. AY1C2]
MTESTTPAEKGLSFGPRRPKKRALTIGIAVGALGLVALGSTAAFAATPSSTPTSSATPLHSTSTDAPSTDAPSTDAPAEGTAPTPPGPGRRLDAHASGRR